MYKVTSNQMADQSEVLVELDLIRRGYVPLLPRSRDHIYDILVERAHDRFHHPLFETIQVKTVGKEGKVATSTRGNGSRNERVSANGKVRNSTAYADYLIDWIAAVTYDGQVIYYPYEVYKEFDLINIHTVHGRDFGSRIVPSHCIGVPSTTNRGLFMDSMF